MPLSRILLFTHHSDSLWVWERRLVGRQLTRRRSKQISEHTREEGLDGGGVYGWSGVGGGTLLWEGVTREPAAVTHRRGISLALLTRSAGLRCGACDSHLHRRQGAGSLGVLGAAVLPLEPGINAPKHLPISYQSITFSGKWRSLLVVDT